MMMRHRARDTGRVLNHANMLTRYTNDLAGHYATFPLSLQTDCKKMQRDKIEHVIIAVIYCAIGCQYKQHSFAESAESMITQVTGPSCVTMNPHISADPRRFMNPMHA